MDFFFQGRKSEFISAYLQRLIFTNFLIEFLITISLFILHAFFFIIHFLHKLEFLNLFDNYVI